MYYPTAWVFQFFFASHLGDPLKTWTSINSGYSDAVFPMVLCVGLYHGYELTGSGSNEYTRYIARGLARLGHDVHVLCRDRRPASLPFVRAAYLWTLGGAGGLSATRDLLFLRDGTSY